MMDAPWKIQLFGGLCAELGDRVVSRLRTRKTGGLLAYLAYYRDRSHPRGVLLELCWPGTDYVLEEKLGEGGCGEVLRARHQHTRSPRGFKFCFCADRLRNLKREMTLFRGVRDVLGERSDIARLYAAQLHEAPYYL